MSNNNNIKDDEWDYECKKKKKQKKYLILLLYEIQPGIFHSNEVDELSDVTMWAKNEAKLTENRPEPHSAIYFWSNKNYFHAKRDYFSKHEPSRPSISASN